MPFLSKLVSNILAVSTLAVGLIAGNAQAALVSITGADFDIAYDDSLIGLYGTPTLSGNTVFFTPVNFYAQSLNGNGLDTESSSINLQIIAHSNSAISSLTFNESGDYSLRGASSYVTIGGQISASSSSNNTISDLAFITTASDLTLRDGLNYDWNSTAALSFTDPKWVGVSAIDFAIASQLQASTSASDKGPKKAFVEKKFVGSSISLTVNSTPVPEAETYEMFLLGLAMVTLLTHRKNRKF